MRVHIIGAGLAGLAAAVHLRASGANLRLYEAAPRAGGRCRSYHDPQLGCVIDNGNHLLMSGNLSAMAYLDAIKARDRLTGPASADYPFLDVNTGARWTPRRPTPPPHSCAPSCARHF
jgi:phytoene dehydrogenase-like protein